MANEDKAVLASYNDETKLLTQMVNELAAAQGLKSGDFTVAEGDNLFNVKGTIAIYDDTAKQLLLDSDFVFHYLVEERRPDILIGVMGHEFGHHFMQDTNTDARGEASADVMGMKMLREYMRAQGKEPTAEQVAGAYAKIIDDVGQYFKANMTDEMRAQFRQAAAEERQGLQQAQPVSRREFVLNEGVHFIDSDLRTLDFIYRQREGKYAEIDVEPKAGGLADVIRTIGGWIGGGEDAPSEHTQPPMQTPPLPRGRYEGR